MLVMRKFWAYMLESRLTAKSITVIPPALLLVVFMVLALLDCPATTLRAVRQGMIYQIKFPGTALLERKEN
jgi:hypothetical protein